MHRRFSLVLAAVSLTCVLWCLLEAAPAAGEDIGNGPWVRRATYHVDRWGQASFGSWFVDPALHEQFNAFNETPARLKATRLLQTDTSDAAMICKVEQIEQLPAAVTIKIGWDSAADMVSTGPLLRIREKESARLNVTLRNLSDLPLVLAQHAAFLSVRTHHQDILGFCGACRRLTYFFDKGDDLSICEGRFYLERLNAEVRLSDMSWHHAYIDRESPPTLEPGKSLRSSITLADTPASEYELALAFHRPPGLNDFEGQQPVYSNWLRLDALADDTWAWESVKLRLQAIDDLKNGAQRRIAVVFKNVSDERIRFGLYTDEMGREDLTRSLLFYDREGTLLRTAGKKRRDGLNEIVLEPQGQHIVEVDVPEKAVLARAAWHHSVSFDNEKGKPRSVGTDYYIFSPHLLLPLE